ncbi:MAG: DinB family protein [Planctomycetes bacterium]|nr:DinB family protein [Planctomycetota bacterium]
MPKRSIDQLVAGNLAFLSQGHELIRRLADELYSAPPPGGLRGGIGAHFRHVLDHYECFLAGWREARIDYDRRERDPRTETERPYALDKIASLRDAFECLLGADPERALDVVVDCGEPGERFESRSTLARELQFLVSHTVHHYAVIALILRARGVEPGAEFGVAPSTLKYEQGTKACAR